MGVAEQNVVVEHEKGLHARPATVFVQTASEFDCEIEVTRLEDGEVADAKSSLGVMSLGVEPNDEIRISAEGDNSETAVNQLIRLVEHDFEHSDG